MAPTPRNHVADIYELYPPSNASPAGSCLATVNENWKLPWPADLRSRILQAVEACQALDVDQAIQILLVLDLQLGAISRDIEKEYEWQ